jgi:hypothetical protein
VVSYKEFSLISGHALAPLPHTPPVAEPPPGRAWAADPAQFLGKKKHALARSLAHALARSLAHALARNDLIPNSLARSVAPRTRRQPPGLGRPSPSAVSPAPTVASRPRRRQAPTARPRPPVPVGRLPSAQWSADRRQASPPPGPDRQASRPPFKVRELPIPTSSCSFSAAP